MRTAPVVTTSLPATTSIALGTAFNFSYQTSSATPVVYTLASGSLPPGLSLSSTGVLSGTPTQSGTYIGTIGVSNGQGSTTTQTFTITVTNATDTPAMPVWGLGILAVLFFGIASRSLGVRTMLFATMLIGASFAARAQTPVQTTSAPAFDLSLGVACHINGGQPEWENQPLLLADMAYIKATNIRDGTPYSVYLPVYTALAKTGVKFVLEQAQTPQGPLTTINSAGDTARRRHAGRGRSRQCRRHGRRQ